MPRRSHLTIAAAFLAFVCSEARPRAEVVAGGGDVPPVTEAPMGRLAVQRGVQGPAGLFTARLHLLVDASAGRFGKPTSFAPDLFYSITDTVQVGLLHTGPMGWQSRPGVGLCLTGESNGCPKVYDNVGLDLMYGLLYGDFHLSLHSSLFLMPLSDPMGVMWTVGVAGKFHFSDMVALFFDPKVGIMLANRDAYNELLFMPIELQVQATHAVSLKLLSGIIGQLSELGDTYQIPLGLGILANVSPRIDLGLRFSFDSFLGQVAAGVSRTDVRSIALLVNIRN